MMKDEIKILMDQIESKDSEIVTLNTEVTKLKGMINEREEDNTLINDEVISKDTRLIQSLNLVADLKKEKEALEAKLESGSEGAGASEGLEKLRTENKKLKKAIEEVEASLEEQKSDMDCLEEEKKELEETKGNLEEDVKDYKKKIVKIKGENKELI